MSLSKPVNEDLAKERRACTFNIEEVTNILDGGKDKTLQRKKIGNCFFFTYPSFL